MAAPTAPESFSDIGHKIADEAAGVLRSEIGLVRAHVSEILSLIKGAVICLAIAAVLLVLFVIFGLATVAVVVGDWLFPHHPWISWLGLTVLCLVPALLLALSGYRRIRRTLGGVHQTIDALKEEVTWVKRLTKRNASEI